VSSEPLYAQSGSDFCESIIAGLEAKEVRAVTHL